MIFGIISICNSCIGNIIVMLELFQASCRFRLPGVFEFLCSVSFHSRLLSFDFLRQKAKGKESNKEGREKDEKRTKRRMK